MGEGGAHPRVAGLAAGLAVQRCGDRHKRPEVRAATLTRPSPAPAFFMHWQAAPTVSIQITLVKVAILVPIEIALVEIAVDCTKRGTYRRAWGTVSGRVGKAGGRGRHPASC